MKIALDEDIPQGRYQGGFVKGATYRCNAWDILEVKEGKDVDEGL